MNNATYTLKTEKEYGTLQVIGDWVLNAAPTSDAIVGALESGFQSTPFQSLCLETHMLGTWDSSLAITLLQLTYWCETKHIKLDISAAPDGLQQLVKLATAIPAHIPPSPSQISISQRLEQHVENIGHRLHTSLTFVGDISLALISWLRGHAKTRNSDIAFFVDQAGPKALAIVTLIALLVGMILAYLGSVQLKQLGAQVYVADLVAIGMVREMGALMTAVIMAGRTGAAYAAQLGTMQVNEEIDALKTMGISSMEFLVLPRLLALVFVMPLLCIYANTIGMLGGAIVAYSMDVGLIQYILQSQGAVDWSDIITGLVKSIFFGILIAIAGCQAGLHCGRNSDAVGMAATRAVVSAIIYLVVADAAFNILYDKMGV